MLVAVFELCARYSSRTLPETQTTIIPRNDFMGNDFIDELVFMVWKNCGAIAVIRVILR
jgi:hypothetical protein